MAGAEGASRGRIFVWDVPIRLFHWSIVGLIAFSWWSATSFHMDWHRWSGLAVCGLLVFRILWGLVGTSTARFATFVRGPGAAWAYLRGRHPATIGHNPLGSWSVVALLLVLVTQVVSGLFAVDIDGIESGPLSDRIDFDQGRIAAAIHHLGWTALMILIALHVATILVYLLIKRRNLTGAMLTGYQRGRGAAGEQGAIRAPRWRLVAVIAVAAIAAWWVANGLRLG
jgi:cytochrome b